MAGALDELASASIKTMDRTKIAIATATSANHGANIELVIRTWTVLERCKMNNIAISRKKFEMGKEIEFAGHIISETGIRPDEKKFTAIKQFPTPSCIRDVRAFLGLANQSDFYLCGLPHFEIWTNHKPLVRIFSKGLNNLGNPRLMRFRQKIMLYNFRVKCVPGKTHNIEDPLSCASLFSAAELKRPKGHRRYDTLPLNLQRPSARYHNRSSRR